MRVRALRPRGRLAPTAGPTRSPLGPLPLAPPPVAPIGLGGSGRPPGLAWTALGALGTRRSADNERPVLNPRELAARLDRYVVGQDKAKKVLAVAVYNHYARLRHLAASRPPAPPPPEPSEGEIPSDALTPSYCSPPPGLVPRRRRLPVTVTVELDPTAYESLPAPTPAPAPVRRRKAIDQREREREHELEHDSHSPNSTLPRPTDERRDDDEPLVHEKSNVLLLGPTGSGKSLLARTLARTLDVPFVGVEATGMTMAGYVGEDVESCVHRLLVAADYDPVRASTGIIFIDEIDKLARSPHSLSKDVGGEGVQQALLKILEGTIVSVPEREGRRGSKKESQAATSVDTTNVLFILSGAFVGLEEQIARRNSRGSIGFGAQLVPRPTLSFFTPSARPSSPSSPDLSPVPIEPSDLVSFGFIPEFIGRLPVLASLLPLSASDLLRVLTEPRNALVRQYESLFRASGVEIRFTTPALSEVARRAVERGTGARGLRGILEGVLLETMFIAPASSIHYVLIDRQVVRDGKEARCYSRGQHSIFESDFKAEESEERAEQEAKERAESAEGDGESEAEVFEKRRATG